MTLPSLDALSGISFTPEVIIALILALSVLYGLILGRTKLKFFALSLYVGVVIAGTFGKGLHELVQKSNFSLSLAVIQLILFGLPVLLLEIGFKEHSRKKGRGGMMMTFILAVLTAALVISSALSMLDAEAIKDITSRSFLAFEIYTFRTWWLALVPVAITAEMFIKPKDH